jgi:hypothetical protein
MSSSSAEDAGMADQLHPVIVAGFDPTLAGLDAVAFGRDLAEATGAVLVVAHVYAYQPGPLPEPPFEQDVEDKLRRHAFAELRGAEAMLAGFERWEPCVVGAPPPPEACVSWPANVPPT